MVSREDNKYVIWPLYFDKDISRKDGRRVPRHLAVKNPDIDKIRKALLSLRIEFEVEKDARHPSKQWEYRGRILVEKTKTSKGSLLKMIAKEMKQR